MREEITLLPEKIVYTRHAIARLLSKETHGSSTIRPVNILLGRNGDITPFAMHKRSQKTITAGKASPSAGAERQEKEKSRDKHQRKTFLASLGCPSTGQYGHLNLLENVSLVIS